MSKNVQAVVPGRKQASMTTKTLTYCALLAALQVAMARLFGLMPSEFTRFSIEAIPTILAGIFFGPVAGGLVGFVADLVGCLFSGFGYNPLFCVPPILYGVCGGLFRWMLVRKVSIWRVLLTIAPAAVFGSIFYQSWALGFVSGKGFWFFFSTRSIQFAITVVVEVIVIRLLFKAKIFQHMKVWPPQKTKKESEL
jgi:ECF transporter S component (folate family)